MLAMDSLANLLDGPRARGAFTLRTVMREPWCLRVRAESPLTLIAGIAGAQWLVPDTGNAIQIGVGDIAVTRAPDHYNLADSPDARPQVFIDPGQACCDASGASLKQQMMHGVRTWGNDPTGSCVFLVGAYEHLSDVSDRLLRVLPPVLTVKKADWESPLIALLAQEVVRDGPGQGAVLDRLLDLLLTAVLRAWLAGQDRNCPGWWRSQEDPVIARALQFIHKDPSRAWIVEQLARESGASRASFARRFNQLVGETPMTFITNWRLALAADLLCQPGQTVATVADQVGYATPYAFSAAFKRSRGISPSVHRLQALHTDSNLN